MGYDTIQYLYNEMERLDINLIYFIFGYMIAYIFMIILTNINCLIERKRKKQFTSTLCDSEKALILDYENSTIKTKTS